MLKKVSFSLKFLLSRMGGTFSRDTIVIGSGLMFGRLLGFLRELLLGRQFGVSTQMDAIVASMNIADTVISILFGGAVAAVVIPPLAKLSSDNRQEDFWDLALNLGNALAILLLFLTIAGVMSARSIASIIAPGLPVQSFELAVRLLRVILGSLAFTGMAFILTPVLQSRRQFLVPASSAVIQNGMAIIVIWLLVPALGPMAIAWGVVVSALLRLGALSLNATREGFRWRWVLNTREPQMLKIMKLIIPSLLGYSVMEINLLVDRNFASHLREGSIAALNYADKLVQVPLAVFASALSIAVLPTFSILAAKNDWKGLRAALVSAMRLLLLLTLPVSAFLMILREPVIELIFKRGAFDANAVNMTAPALFWYATSLPFHSASLLLIRIFHSKMDFKTPLWIGVFVVAIHCALNVICIVWWGHVGIAISSAVTAMIYTLLLIGAIRVFTPLRFKDRLSLQEIVPA